MQNVIEVRNLGKEYRDFSLQDISFDLPEGFVMGLIGPNGAGKTTIIKLIMNHIRSSGGTVTLFGKDHRQHEIAIKKRIGFVFDNPSYYDHLNLKQLKNVIAPFYREWDEVLFRQLCERFELPLRKITKNFSRGMIMKAALAVALSHHADLIIMDEPTSGLDPVFRRELLDLFYELLQNEKKSILFSTHITSDLEKIADYITFILDGQLVFSDTKENIMENYAIVKGDSKILDEETGGFFKGVKPGEFGFEALTDDITEAERRFGSEVVIDKASLEDIMYFSKLRETDDQVD